ncbi:NAD-dependent succinate-semialdehyde dehydrogenase [Cocleimonas sp. KMM 6892]|uniref:NAD-dependent succinate-semialdehyde dehydrogenase n=1 Tax=unclassified Cocleimonas TaxID=2639732 RepID=UPI002DBD59EF|nr:MULTISPECIES: NAD-dependent succinate-semialdehyde dehydrogenase [unclassified Cocleimonas]MEB8434226.1 NAD-dependent succinate-semialdehyde dehydrogenase [Cocleimonas sp. KMM 6892]MEC4717155.1 NAD-dependent succinate-semialdehyde dehydrogenase [Cocleimonas sp. KMM 6895]MEC4746498.1 NAD-dependent succinate-semialdehyde dehydrogenase [Cocleimonas sp. KMM 6896]
MKLNDNSLFRQQAYVNGNWIDADDGKTFEVTNPATNEVIGTVPDLGAAETKRAIEAANEAWPAWRAKTAAERSAILETWFNLIMENQADLAALMTLEQGKSIAESTGEVAYGASFIKWFAEECKRVYGDTIPSKNTDQRIVVTKEPIGVCAAITPWNFPNAMITRKAAPAFGAGCPMVVKPAEATPFSALALAELAERAGIPAGIFSVVTASQGKDVGEEMTTNPIVRKVTFTGSTAVGKILMKQCSSTLKKMSLELGGNAPFIVFEDADLEAAVEGLMVSKYRNSGQTCVCTNRTIVHESVYDEFAAKLAAKVGELKVGDGFEEGVNQGPLINMAAVEKVEDHISDAVEKGAKVLVGGKRHELGKTFFEPTLLANVTTDMKVTYEETFGPVAPLFSFKTEAEAIQMANDTEFGLAAYFFSRDIGRSWRVSEALEYGMVGVNSGLISTEVAPFGGVKESGLGREGSKFGLDEYLETKYICMAGVSS